MTMSFPKRLYEPADVPDGAILSRDEAKSLVDRVITMSKAESIQVNIGGGYTANVRFADNQMSTAGGVTDFTVVIQSSFGKKHSFVTVNNIADEALQRAVAQSEALAKLAPAKRAKAARAALEPARTAGDLTAAAFLVTNASSTALGNDKGMFAYHR